MGLPLLMKLVKPKGQKLGVAAKFDGILLITWQFHLSIILTFQNQRQLNLRILDGFWYKPLKIPRMQGKFPIMAV